MFVQQQQQQRPTIIKDTLNKQIEQFVHANLQRTVWSDIEQNSFFNLSQRHGRHGDNKEWQRVAADMNRSPLDIKLFAHTLFINANAGTACVAACVAAVGIYFP